MAVTKKTKKSTKKSTKAKVTEVSDKDNLKAFSMKNKQLVEKLNDMDYENQELLVENNDLKLELNYLKKENKMFYSPLYRHKMMYKSPKNFVQFITDIMNIAFVVVIVIVAYYNNLKLLLLPTIGIIMFNIISLIAISAFNRIEEDEKEE